MMQSPNWEQFNNSTIQQFIPTLPPKLKYYLADMTIGVAIIGSGIFVKEYHLVCPSILKIA